jgi:hypothetical protein
MGGRNAPRADARCSLREDGVPGCRRCGSCRCWIPRGPRTRYVKDGVRDHTIHLCWHVWHEEHVQQRWHLLRRKLLHPAGRCEDLRREEEEVSARGAAPGQGCLMCVM